MSFSIAVICPTFNSSKFITKTLKSLVNQSLKPDLIVFSDDGSTDDTTEVIVSFMDSNNQGIKYKIINSQNQGPGAARNKGIHAANCDWIAFIDSDDIWKDNKLELVQEYILKYKSANFFCHNEEFMNLKGAVSNLSYGLSYKNNLPLMNQLYIRNMFSTSAIICLRELLVDNGCFNESLQSAQDYECWLRLSKKMSPIFIPEVLGVYVQRKGNISSGNLKNRFCNEITIALMYRKDVPKFLVLLRLLRICISFIRQYFRLL